MKKLKNLTRKIAFLSCAAALLLGLFATTAFAREAVDLTKDVSLEISFKDGDTAVAGSKFSLYRVADMDKSANFTATADFASSGVDLSPVYGESESVWSGRATALAGYIAQKSSEGSPIAPAATAATDSEGKIAFTKDNASLSAGLYIFIGTSTQVGDVIYTPIPTLVTLPYNDTATDTWDYAPSVSPKYDKKTAGPSTIDLNVVVVWEDDDDALGLRPDEVTIVLTRTVTTAGGTTYEEYDRVTIGTDEDWRHTWTNLLENEDWQVSELLLPDGYTYTVRREGDTFIVTNTIKTADTTTTPTTGGKTSTGGTSGGSKLPQTGQLWWPISFLAAGGAACVLFGLALRRKGAAK